MRHTARKLGTMASVNRAGLVSRYLESGLGQAQFCADYERTTGERLSPRTLRSWIGKFGPRSPPGIEVLAAIDETLTRLGELRAGLAARLAIQSLESEAVANGSLCPT